MHVELGALFLVKIKSLLMELLAIALQLINSLPRPSISDIELTDCPSSGLQAVKNESRVVMLEAPSSVLLGQNSVHNVTPFSMSLAWRVVQISLDLWLLGLWL
ncbi:hypothetical protein Tco_1409827 [Tanacetum coccineum]